MGFPGGSVVKNLPVNTGDMGSIPGSGKIPWSKKWQPTPVFLPVKSHGQRSLASYRPWGHKELDMTEYACMYIHTHTHTHTHTHKDFGHKRNWFQWPPPLLGDSLKLSMSFQTFVFPSVSSLSFYPPRTTVAQHYFSGPPPDCVPQGQEPCCPTAQLSPARLLCLWDSPCKNTRVGSHFLLQAILPTQELKLGFLYCRQILLYAGILIFL